MCYPAQFGCTEDGPQYKEDPEKARKLLAEAGYPNGFEETLYAYRDRPYTEAVMNYLRAVGIKTKLRFLQWKALRPVIDKGQVTMAQLTWRSEEHTSELQSLMRIAYAVLSLKNKTKNRR